VPGDKSISHRALLLGALAEGQTTIRGFLAGEDCLATMAALRALGVQIDDTNPDEIKVSGAGLHGFSAPAGPLNMGNSGTGMRLLAGILAGQEFATELTGDQSLRSRPMERVAKPLRRMGATVDTADGCPPLHIKGGELRAIMFRSPVASAQLKSAVLLAGLFASGVTRVEEPAVTRDHTERMLQTFGVPVRTGELTAELSGPASLKACEVRVPGDLSSAAFPLAAGLLSSEGEVVVEGVGINPTRTGIIEILRLMGADLRVEKPGIEGTEPVATLAATPSRLQGIEIPTALVSLAIDELPLIFALAACAEGETLIRGADELRHKESDRIGMMVKNLHALGIEVEEFDDGARIVGGQLRGGTVDSAGDHRIAMAFTVAAMCADGSITVLDTANVATSFPDFVPLMQSLGLQVEQL
jgi:3-phosphoshikimate 1-carboxyvinyltransferase